MEPYLDAEGTEAPISKVWPDGTRIALSDAAAIAAKDTAWAARGLNYQDVRDTYQQMMDTITADKAAIDADLVAINSVTTLAGLGAIVKKMLQRQAHLFIGLERVLKALRYLVNGST